MTLVLRISPMYTGRSERLDLHEHLAPNNAGVKEAKGEATELWSNSFAYPERRYCKHYSNRSP